AWPRIEELELITTFHSRQPLLLTLECLRSFASHCPRLEKLRITFDGSVLPTPFTNASAFVPQRRLEQLHVDYSSLSAPIPVASFISSLFPNLREV
ncbi:hypothetical protein C8R43DRAFT_833152, partial [Mycena crocata]